MKKPRRVALLLALLLCVVAVTAVPAYASAIMGPSSLTFQIGVPGESLDYHDGNNHSTKTCTALPQGLDFVGIFGDVSRITGTAAAGTAGAHTATIYSTTDPTHKIVATITIEKGPQTITPITDKTVNSSAGSFLITPESQDGNNIVIDVYAQNPGFFGGNAALIAQHQPQYSFSSSVPGVADIDASGQVTLYSEGTTVIKVSSSATESYLAAQDMSFTVTVDDTAPILSNGSAVRDSHTTGSVTFNTDEAGTAFYLAMSKNAAVPTIADVKAGNNLGAVSSGIQSGFPVQLTAGAKDIYVVVEDAAGNISNPFKIPVQAYSSGGNTTKTNASVSPVKATFDKNPEGEMHRDIAVTLSKGSYQLTALTFGGNTLISGQDYTVSGDRYIIHKDFLSLLEPGTYGIRFNMSGGRDAVLTITVDRTGEPENWKNPFTDVKESDWFYGNVEYVYMNGFFKGTSTTTFEPEAAMDRDMLVTVLGRLSGDIISETGFDMPFTDVDATSYAAPYIAWAADHGIVKGFSADTFGAEKSLTREQIAEIMYRYAVYKGKAPTDGMQETLKYPDTGSISAWAQNGAMYCQKYEIIKGNPDGSFDPQGKATRAEVAAMLHRFAENVK